jgi:hypothetical protein
MLSVDVDEIALLLGFNRKHTGGLIWKEPAGDTIVPIISAKDNHDVGTLSEDTSGFLTAELDKVCRWKICLSRNTSPTSSDTETMAEP